MTKPKLRIGLIGSGFMGKAHAFGYSAAAQVFDLPYDLELRYARRHQRRGGRKGRGVARLRPRHIRLARARRQSRHRYRQHHRAERAAQGDGAGGDRGGQARLLRKALSPARSGRPGNG